VNSTILGIVVIKFVPMDCWFVTFENVSYRTHGHNILNFAPQISSETLLMLEEGYGMVVENRGLHVA
jgi:hypothetical protein